METPIPTPFDIIDPGPGQLVPTSFAWLLLFTLAALAGLILALRSRRPAPKNIYRTLTRLVHELKKAADSGDKTADLDRIIRLARRIVSPYLEDDATSLTSDELRIKSQTIRAKKLESLDSLAGALSTLADLEEFAYAPKGRRNGGDKLDDLVKLLVDTLEQHVRRYKPI
jgi:hypothetical protein